VGGNLINTILGESIASTPFFKNILTYGAFGVSFFFIISGFIVSLPFAEQKLLHKKQVDLTSYFFRRLTRIEPLYVVTLVLYFIMRVWVLHYQPLHEVLPHFFASLFYVHNIVYHDFSLINGVAWSLEVEIQFYILAPLLTNIFFIRNKSIRWAVFFAIIVTGYAMTYYVSNWYGILFYGYLFFIGMFFAELYLSRTKSAHDKRNALLALMFLIVTLLVPAKGELYNVMPKFLFLLFFFYLGITNSIIKKILSYQLVAIIGGMCYSIYLIHMGVWGIIRHWVEEYPVSGYAWLNGLLYYVFTIACVLIVSGIFFLLIEKPTMKRDWYKRRLHFS
jgi:peptidoglycan/LPS O-acetylase OafA/YrhL